MNPIIVTTITVLVILVILVIAEEIARRQADDAYAWMRNDANRAWEECLAKQCQIERLTVALASATDRANAANRRAAQAANAIRNLPALHEVETAVGVHLGPFSVN